MVSLARGAVQIVPRARSRRPFPMLSACHAQPGKFYMSLMDLLVDFVFYVDIVLNFHRCVLTALVFPPLL